MKVQRKSQDNVSRMVQPQAGGERQSNTDRFCLPIPLTSALDTFKYRTRWPLGLWGEEIKGIFEVQLNRCFDIIFHWHGWKLVQTPIFQLHHSTRLLHPIQVQALPPGDYIRRFKKPEESFERILESTRDRLDSWKMGVGFDTQLRCENPRLFNVSAKSLLYVS